MSSTCYVPPLGYCQLYWLLMKILLQFCQYFINNFVIFLTMSVFIDQFSFSQVHSFLYQFVHLLLYTAKFKKSETNGPQSGFGPSMSSQKQQPQVLEHSFLSGDHNGIMVDLPKSSCKKDSDDLSRTAAH